MANVAAFHPGSAIVIPHPAPVADCWSRWGAAEIVSCTQCPYDAVVDHWPAIYTALAQRGIASPEVQAGALATVAVETAHTFAPVEEAFWLDDVWRYANLRYAPYWGRGYIQLTWDYNYQSYGGFIGMDLYGQPDLALEHQTAAVIFAEFFGRSGAAQAAEDCDWVTCRQRVQGADAGLDELIAVTSCLGYP